MPNKTTKLYNVIFPIWMLWIFPLTWLVILPANFVIDLLVTALTMKVLKIDHIWATAKPVILKVWLFGFLADLIGTAVMLVATFLDEGTLGPAAGKWWYQNISYPVNYNPFQSVYGFLWVTLCVVLAAFMIYLFNRKVSFKKAPLTDRQKRQLSLSLAVFTAPYLFYLPTILFVR
ncbi:hypothetical protein SDC9_132458 [bioreactor metagenome]|uniref:Uncharacterized protein n=1 Tax=bioreactor metagenome TaxID=1076179 RepID=A0A645D8J9_9ZZZZ